MRFPSKAATFMRELQQNNDRDWFASNKPRYEAAKAEVEAFAKTVHAQLAQDDELEPSKNALLRIYRDTRFSKDKTPYKRHWGGSLDRLGSERRGGYYWHYEPGGVEQWPEFAGADAFAGGGFWAPEVADLARVREELAADASELRKILNHEDVRAIFGGELYPAALLKTAPRDYPKDHPAIDLLRHKSFVLVRKFTKHEIASDSFSDEIVRTFRTMRPFLDYMSNVLTTDANGQPITRLS